MLFSLVVSVDQNGKTVRGITFGTGCAAAFAKNFGLSCKLRPPYCLPCSDKDLEFQAVDGRYRFQIAAGARADRQHFANPKGIEGEALLDKGATLYSIRMKRPNTFPVESPFRRPRVIAVARQVLTRPMSCRARSCGGKLVSGFRKLSGHGAESHVC